MKKITIILFMVLINHFAYAQNTYYGTETFSYNSNTVHHYGLGWYFDSDASAYGPMAYLSSFGGIKFFTGGTIKNVIDINGNFGIGTSHPLALLNVVVPNNKTIATGSIVSFLSTNEVSGPFGLRTMIYGAAALSNRYITLQTTDYATTDGGNIILQPATGNVGIGTEHPSAKLDIANNVSIGAQGGSDVTTISGGAGFGSTIKLYYADGVENIRLAGNNDSYLNINHGNVGIGTTAPDAKLAVKGTIHSQEVKVDLNVPGPDYVFHPTYKLPLLSEVKTYVDKNHHLSEIPSAAEMAKNGLDLGDMNMKLLKKVEELTLYLIEKDKEINDLKQQKSINQTQQNQIDELRKQMEALLRKHS